MEVRQLEAFTALADRVTVKAKQNGERNRSIRPPFMC